MGRLLILGLIVLVVAWWLFGRVARLREGDAARRSAGQAGPPTSTVQDMVACAHCGLHLPRGEAVLDGTRSYCGQAHRLLGPRDGPRE